MVGEVAFEPPALPEETLMEREHTDTLRDLGFLLSFAEGLMEVAAVRRSHGGGGGPAGPPPCCSSSSCSSSWERVGGGGGPPRPSGLPLLQQSGGGTLPQHSLAHYGTEWGRAEQLVLYMKAAELLASALHLAKEKVEMGKLSPSTAVKQVARCLNVRYKESVQRCRELASRLARFLCDKQSFACAVGSVSAERLVYAHAVELVRATALDEMFHHVDDEVMSRYRKAALLLDGLGHLVTESQDLEAIAKYKLYVERHLENLQQQQQLGGGSVVDY
ncbi:serine/threonine-protein kinase ULK2-like isoform X3 [Petromyzon marinus]|uniref:serine/threonine-protein kinase ULK2-like isoform X3 n=1 Tax=Petromyzon marinus TaxID=7757 RepID=UPI003F6E9AA1